MGPTGRRPESPPPVEPSPSPDHTVATLSNDSSGPETSESTQTAETVIAAVPLDPSLPLPIPEIQNCSPQITRLSITLAPSSTDAVIQEMRSVLLRFFIWRGHDLLPNCTFEVATLVEDQPAENADIIELHPTASDHVEEDEDEKEEESTAEFDIQEEVSSFEKKAKFH